MEAATSTSSRRNVQRRSHGGSTSTSSSARNTGHSSGRRHGNSSIMRRESFLEGERSALPEIGERTIFVTDEGLIVSTDRLFFDSTTVDVVAYSLKPSMLITIVTKLSACFAVYFQNKLLPSVQRFIRHSHANCLIVCSRQINQHCLQAGLKLLFVQVFNYSEVLHAQDVLLR